MFASCCSSLSRDSSRSSQCVIPFVFRIQLPESLATGIVVTVKTPLMVVFVSPRSGGRHGPALKDRLQQFMCEEQVFDLSDVKPLQFVRYGLACLEMLAGLGDSC